MIQTTKICLILILLIINGCSMFSDKKQIETKKNTLVNQEALTSYKHQEHRLSFNECELTYNEKPFYLGQQIEDLIKILGPYTRKIKKYSVVAFIWEEIGLFMYINTRNRKGDLINEEKQHFNFLRRRFIHTKIDSTDSENRKKRMEQRRKDFPIKKDYILVNGVPLKKGTIMKDYMKETGKDFGFFTKTSRSGYQKNYKACQIYPNQEIKHYFTTDVDFESKDYGKVAITGNPIHGTNQIIEFEISLDDKEE